MTHATSPTISGVPRRAPVVLPQNDRSAPWRELRVLNVAVQHPPDGTAPCTVESCVGLGKLLPADVTVEASVEYDETVAAAGADTRYRLWSESAYGDGSFLYLVRIPRATLEHARRVCVSVRPASNASSAVPMREDGVSTGCRDL